MTVRRFDVSSTSGARLLDNGWLRAEGVVARTGIQEYRRGDGTMIRELRLPEEVFRPDALDALALAPVTDEHPPAMLDATNTKNYACGHLVDRVEIVDGRLVRATLLVTDAQLVEKVLAGKQAELSVGYFCDLEHAPGEWQGERYDAIQRNIAPNHVALTRAARGGRELRVKLDSGDAVSVDAAEARVLVADAALVAGVRRAQREGRLLEEMRARADAAHAARLRDAVNAWRRPLAGLSWSDASDHDDGIRTLKAPDPPAVTPLPGFARWE